MNKDCLNELSKISSGKIWLYAGTSENLAVLVGKSNFIVSKNLSSADNQQERLELNYINNFEKYCNELIEKKFN